MTTLTLSLPDEMKAFIEAQAARDGHTSVDEYVRTLVLQAQKREAKLELEAKLLEGMQGPFVPLTRGEWESMEREALGGPSDEAIRP